MKPLHLLYQEKFRDVDGKRFNNMIEHYVTITERQRATRINAMFPRGTILDVGCGRGIFLSEMKKFGWEVLGTEIFRGLEKISESLSIPIKIGELNDIGMNDESFDIVTLWHTIEHIEDLSILQKIRNILKKGGILIVSVPNIESFQAKIFKEKWIHYNAEYHLHHFSPHSLSLLLIKNGFSPFRIRYFCFTYNFFGWLEGFIDIFLRRQNILFGELRKCSENAFIKRLIIYSFAVGLAIPALCAVFIELLFRRGGTIELYAKKY